MASLFIKDSKTAERVAQIAARLGTTKTDVVWRAMDALEENLPPERIKSDLREKLDAWRRAHPLPPSTGLKADKAFYDEMWGED